MNKWMAAMVCTGLAMIGGCGNAGDTTGSAKTVVIDLQLVAKSLGSDLVIQQYIQENNNRLVGQLNAIQTSLNDLWQKEMVAAGVKDVAELQKLDEKPRTELATKFQNYQNELRARMGQAEQISKNFQLQMLMNFREQVKPVAMRVANRRGASIVMITAEPMLSWDPAVDITAEVITEMKSSAQPLQIPQMAAPPNQLPTGTNAAPGAAAPGAAAPSGPASTPAAPPADQKK